MYRERLFNDGWKKNSILRTYKEFLHIFLGRSIGLLQSAD
jgi:hypothetical protein